MLPELIPFRIGSCRAPERASRADGRFRRITFPAGAALIRLPHRGDTLFDCGYGESFFTATQSFPERLYRWATPVRFPAEESLPQQLAGLGSRPSLVLLSHLHADHIAGLFDLEDPPPAMTSRAAWTHLAEGGRLATLQAGCPDGLRRRIQSLCMQFIEDSPIAEPLKGGAALGPGYDISGDGSLLAIPLPGHGFGQFGLFLPQSTTGPHFLIADAAWSRAALRDNAPPPGITLRRLGDEAAYRRTFAALRALMRARPEITFWPSHCPEAFR